MPLKIEYKDIFDLDVTKQFCKLFVNITHFILDINDSEGNRPKELYGENILNDYCKYIRSCEKGRDACNLSGRRGGKIAFKNQEPNIYVCHAGLIDVAIPLIIRSKHIATIVTGQFLLKETKKRNYGNILNIANTYGLDHQKLKSLYLKTPVIDIEIIHNYINLIKLIINYIIEVEERILCLKEQSNKPVVNKVIEYITENLDKKILLDDISKYVNISKFYMEHLFKKETGFTIVQYINNLKIDKAKKLLIRNNKTNTRICYELGFNSYSYFYKIFKITVGMTPSEYKTSLIS